ncbi:MADS-box protein SOC1 [Glycine max]|nr:MADS-box protein SOC1 [Glycine max]
MLQHLKQEAANMMKKIGLLEAAKRKFLGEGLGACSIEELQWIQQQLERSLSNVRARKIQVFKEQIEQLKEKTLGFLFSMIESNKPTILILRGLSKTEFCIS